jgi:hypothetical protein
LKQTNSQINVKNLKEGSEKAFEFGKEGVDRG